LLSKPCPSLFFPVGICIPCQKFGEYTGCFKRRVPKGDGLWSWFFLPYFPFCKHIKYICWKNIQSLCLRFLSHVNVKENEVVSFRHSNQIRRSLKDDQEPTSENSVAKNKHVSYSCDWNCVTKCTASFDYCFNGTIVGDIILLWWWGVRAYLRSRWRPTTLSPFIILIIRFDLTKIQSARFTIEWSYLFCPGLSSLRSELQRQSQIKSFLLPHFSFRIPTLGENTLTALKYCPPPLPSTHSISKPSLQLKGYFHLTAASTFITGQEGVLAQPNL
jgi:hypothetical protein